MGNFNQGNRPGGRRDFGGGRGLGRPSMHKAICNECGKECEVPFRPTGDRPVFCSTCFEKHGTANSGRSGEKKYQRSGFDDKRMFEAVCSKCGNKCEVPFRPTGEKPVYCSQCFGKGGSTSSKSPEQFKQQFEVLNAKLDKILKVLMPVVSAEVSKAPRSEKGKEETKKDRGVGKKKVVVKKAKMKKK